MKDAPPRAEMLALPIHAQVRFVLVRPHYPENVGAAARAIKTMGFTRLVLVKPSRIATPDHEMTRKMAVKSGDILDDAGRFDTLAEALEGVDDVFATTSRRGMSGVLQPREAGRKAVELAGQQRSIAMVFGNEKSGLDTADLSLAQYAVRIPMAAEQPSVNLAQATQVIAYELFLAALDRKSAEEASI